MTHKRCAGCQLLKPTAAYGKNSVKSDGLQTHCKTCRKGKVSSKRKAEKEEETSLAELATIKKSQHSGHQRRYWLPPSHTEAERLEAFYAVAAPVDEAEVLETVKAAMAMLRLQWGGGPMPADPLGYDFRLAAAMWGVA